MRKRMTSLLLTLVMLLSLVPAMGVTASAAASGNGTQGNPFVVTTYEDWKAAMQQPRETYIQLGADIDTSTMNGGFGLGLNDRVNVGNDIHLNLNGKKLTLLKSKMNSGDQQCFIRVSHGSLTIEDSQSSGEIVGVNNVTRRYMQLIDVLDGAKLTLNSGKLHLELNADADADAHNATIESDGTVEINNGTVAISCPGGWDERAHYVTDLDCALHSSGKAVINSGTFDGRVVLKAVAKDSGAADNVITGGDFKKSIYIQKDKAVTGDVPLNVSIQGGTYHYTPGYRMDGENKVSDPLNNFQFATYGFSKRNIDYTYYPLADGTWQDFTAEYDMNAFASIFPKNAIISATGQEYELIDSRFPAIPVKCEDAVYTGSSTASDLARLVNSHYKTITVTTLPSDALKDMTLTVGDGTPLPAQGTYAVPGDVTLGSDGTLTKNVYITAIGNKQLKEMYYSNPSKIDFRYRLNILKNDNPVTDYTGVISQTYAAVGDEISVSVQLRDFKFGEGVYTFRLALWPYLRGSEAQIGEALVGRWKLTAKEVTEISSAPIQLSAALTPGTSAPSATAVGSGYTVDSIKWYTDSGCTTEASSFEAGTAYYGKIVLKPAENYKFATSAIAPPSCYDPNENYSVVGSYTVADDGSSLTLVVKGTAVSALVWDSVDKDNKTYTIGGSSLTLHAKAVGGDNSMPIFYKLIAKKGGTETVKASVTVAAASTDGFSAPLSFTDIGEYECWFEATRGDVTITSDHFTVTVNAPGLSITNQSGDFTIMQGGYARLFVIVKNASNYQWQVKNGGSWTDLPGATDYDYMAEPAKIGKHIYRCKLTNKYGDVANSNEMTVTVLENETLDRTPVYILPAINEAAPNPAALWPGKVIGSFDLHRQTSSRSAEYTVTAGSYFQAEAFYSVIPGGEGYILEMPSGTQMDLYYNSYEEKQYTAVLGEITYKWEATSKVDQEGFPTKYTEIGTEPTMAIPIPEGVGTYWAKLTITNTIGTGSNAKSQNGCVEITFHVEQPGVGTAVSGTVKSYGSASEAVTVTLLQGTSVIGSPQVLTGAAGTAPYSQTYSYPAVPAGTYTLKVMKKGHAPWTEEITVSSSAVTKNVTIYLIGDVNGDGRVNGTDKAILTRYLANWPGYEAYIVSMAAADINQDGTVNGTDKAILIRYLAGNSSYNSFFE